MIHWSATLITRGYINKIVRFIPGRHVRAVRQQCVLGSQVGIQYQSEGIDRRDPGIQLARIDTRQKVGI